MPDNFTLRQARNLAGITQAEMAKKLGVSRAMYRPYEQYLTLMRVDKANKFSQVTNIPIQRIIFLPQGSRNV